MPQHEIVVTLKTASQNGVWPVVRDTLAWIGFAVVVVVGASILDAPNPEPKRAIEAFRAGVQAYETAYHATASSYGQAPVNPYDGPPSLFDALPALPDNSPEKQDYPQ
jgi:hypothetical protein